MLIMVLNSLAAVEGVALAHHIHRNLEPSLWTDLLAIAHSVEITHDCPSANEIAN